MGDYTIDNICDIIADTHTGLTNAQITKLLKQSYIKEYCPSNDAKPNKRKTLSESLKEEQQKNKCSNNILTFLTKVMESDFVATDPDKFKDWKKRINEQLAFEGYELQDDASLKDIEKASTISNIIINPANLKKALEERNAHELIFNYCTDDLLKHNNYFHSVLEATKGLLKRIKELSGTEKNGQDLIEHVFSNTPTVKINAYQNQSEKNEHHGFKSLLIGLCAMFRNPTAHELKDDWPISEQDALEILGIISYCHRRLDKAQRNMTNIQS